MKAIDIMTTSQLEDTLSAAGDGEDQARLERLRRKRRYSFWRLFRANLWDLRMLIREAWVPLAGFGMLLLVGTTYLYFGYNRFQPPSEQLTFSEAIFETMRMFALEINVDFPTQDPLGQLLFFVIPVLGVALIFQSVMNFGRLLVDKASRGAAWQVSLATTYRNHVIICGLGRVSYGVTLQLLDAGCEVIVVEQDWQSKFVQLLLRLKVPVIQGDARDPEVLRQARIQHARGLLAGINDDMANIEIALAARRLRPKLHLVMRIFDQELDHKLEQTFGRNSAFSSSALAAPTLAAAALSQRIEQVLPLPEGLVAVARLTVAGESELAGFVSQVEEQYQVRILRPAPAVVRRGRQASVRGLRLDAGDEVLALGTLDAIERLRLANQPGSKLSFLNPAYRREQPDDQQNTVIVCGLGKVGYRMVQVLHAIRPRPEIVVVCNSETRPNFMADVQQMGVRIVSGNAGDPAVLQQAGIATAYAVAAVTGSPLMNMQIAMAAISLRADVHLVLRAYTSILAEGLADLFGINATALSSSALAAPTLAGATLVGGIEGAVRVDERMLVALTVGVQVGDIYAGKRICDVRTELQRLVIAVRRSGECALVPALDLRLAPDDEIIVLVDSRDLTRAQRSKNSGDWTTALRVPMRRLRRGSA